MATKPNIEEQLRQAILNTGITRYRLSKLSGVSEATLSLFVNNKRRSITTDTAAKLAAVLGLELTPTKQTKKGR